MAEYSIRKEIINHIIKFQSTTTILTKVTNNISILNILKVTLTINIGSKNEIPIRTTQWEKFTIKKQSKIIRIRTDQIGPFNILFLTYRPKKMGVTALKT